MSKNRDSAGPIPAQRRSRILELVRQRSSASVNELANSIGVSLSTVRRDLDELSRRGYIERSHGGAVLPLSLGTVSEPDRDISAHFAHKEKQAIGRAAAQTLRDGQSVIFDSSSTVMEVAQRVVENGLRLTAVTNDVKIAEILSRSPAIRVVVPGGTIRPGSPTLMGEPGQGFLKGLHVDVAVIGIHAVQDMKLCETLTDLAFLKRCMIEAAERSILVADASKFDLTAFCDVCDIGAVDEIITDDRLHDSHRQRLRQQGVKIRIA